MNLLRPVIATNKHAPSCKIRGAHHMFYADADNEPSVIMEETGDKDGLVWCLQLADWEYRFLDEARTTLNTPVKRAQQARQQGGPQ